MRCRSIASLLAVPLCFGVPAAFGQPAHASGAPPSASAARAIPMSPDTWETQGEVEFVRQDGREAVRLGAGHFGGASPRDLVFATGTMEFDVLADGARDFIQLSFRSNDDGDGDLIYLRAHQSGNPDATQYTPVVNGSLAWQIFTGEGFTSAVRFNFGHWMHVRVDVYVDSALLTIDGEPALIIPHLESPSPAGSITLASVAGALFSNFSVALIDDYRDPRPAVPVPPLPAGTVEAWRVSPAMTEDDALEQAAGQDWAGIEWQRIPVENNGIDNLSLAGPDSEDRHTYLARFTVRSRNARDVAMGFGFSDAVHVFLNGRRLYAGEDVQGSRDYRFLGIVGFWDTLYLPLRAGANEVVFVVTDGTNGGTAAAARFDAEAGLTIE